MRRKDFERLAKTYLVPHLEGFRSHGHLLFMEPIDCLLRGFCFEPSGFDATSMYLNFFIKTLYVPVEYVELTYGDRLRGNLLWEGISKENESEIMADVLNSIRSDGLPCLTRIATLEDLLRFIETERHLDIDPHDVEKYAYALVLLGKHEQAFEQLHHLRRVCDEAISTGTAWAGKNLERGEQVLSALQDNPAEARSLLNTWRSHTLKALKLEKFTTQVAD